MMNKTKTKMTLMARAFGLLLMLVAGTMTGYAQNNVEYFTYEDQGKTIIDGLTYAGEDAEELTIPARVTKVISGAFKNSKGVTSLIVDGEGNPVFEGSLFGEKTNTLTYINMGHGMTIVNMEALLTSLGTTSNINTIVIGGYSGGSWTKETLTGYTWTGLTSITLPAALVENQEFGEAKVYGRFTIDKEIISFCTNATFLDEDTGSNMLFYVADGIADDGRLHIQRVWYVAAGKGVLIHRTDNSSGYADLRRTGDLEDNNERAKADKALYANNMLKGVTTAITIYPTDGDKTNYVLKDGAFHPTSGGTIKANRAYLQIPTASARPESLAISFDDEASGITTTNLSNNTNAVGEWYDLSGRQLSGKPSAKGMYINNGKKYVIK